MKYLFITLIITFSFAHRAHAQIQVCRIFYDYDAAGQRVKRYYDCYNPNEVPPGERVRGFTLIYFLIPPMVLSL